MRKYLLVLLTQVCFVAMAICQKNIDLKTLINMPKDEALQRIKDWGIKLLPTDGANSFSGYKDGIHIASRNDSIATIWVEFTARRKGKFPFQVDPVITPNVNVNKVIKAFGKPDETGNGIKLGTVDLGGWVKWNRPGYQINCEVKNSKVVMVTIMQPDWFPGRR